MVADDQRSCRRITLCNRMPRQYTVIFFMMITIDRFEFVYMFGVMSTQRVDGIFKPVQFACVCVINGRGQLFQCIQYIYCDAGDDDGDNNNSNIKVGQDTSQRRNGDHHDDWPESTDGYLKIQNKNLFRCWIGICLKCFSHKLKHSRAMCLCAFI